MSSAVRAKKLRVRNENASNAQLTCCDPQKMCWFLVSKNYGEPDA
jgi:hypothetical protein